MKFIRLLVFLTVLSALPLSADKIEEEVSPNEDLMQEHGLLNRLLLIYQEVAKRIEWGESYNPEDLKKAAFIVHSFLEGHHEKMEEEHIFKKLEEAGELNSLVAILREQHKVGRTITNYILTHADDNDELLASHLHLYIRMFRPHEAREDTIILPAFRKLVSKEEYEKLGELFEEEEHELFGEGCFERFVSEISTIETSLGIHDLNSFTPHIG